MRRQKELKIKMQKLLYSLKSNYKKLYALGKKHSPYLRLLLSPKKGDTARKLFIKNSKNIAQKYIRKAFGLVDSSVRGDESYEIIPYIKTNTDIIVNKTIANMDLSTKFLMDRNYECKNPAIAVVRMPLVAGLWVMLVFSSIVIIWGAFAPIDSAAVAQGSVTLLSNKKTIQHLEGGIIEEIFVKDGDVVTKNQPLMRLSDVSSIASRDMARAQLYLAHATESRLIAERDNLPEIKFNQDILDSSQTDEALAKIISSQIALFNSHVSGQASKVAALNERINQSKEQIRGQMAQKNSTQLQLNLVRENLKSIQTLVDKGYSTRTYLLGVQRNEKELEGNLGLYDSEIAKIHQSITETEITITNQKNEYETAISDGLHDAQAQISDLTDKLRASQDIVNRAVITAPTNGVVNALKYHTIGGIIEHGMPIMDIVPQDDQLIIEARVKPSDIDIVRGGLDARIMFTAYKAGTTPKVDGKVIQVSADRITDNQMNPPDSYYLARVEVDKKFLSKMAKSVELYPGMPTDVLIKTGSRSFLSYLFSPIIDSMHRAFREE